MNAKRLLAHYERVADAPDAIARVRHFILDLAVRGTLVPQDPNDEPASELLKRIAKEKAGLVKAGEIRKEKPTPQVHAEELPFGLPPGWEWVRLEHLAQKLTDGEHLSPNKTTSGMPLLTAVHVSAKGLTLNNPQFVSMEDGHKSRLRCDPRRGDILICSRGTIGRCAVVDVDDIFCLMGSVIQVRFPPDCVPSYFNYFLSTDRAQAQMRGMSGATAVQALYLKDIRLCPVPLPPLAEQHRIVAKVDELMALCDRLEAARAEREARRDRLAAASLARLNTPDPATFQDDARFALDALPVLTKRSDQIKQLRQTILNLAVRGKLVPQDPNDEPASELLKRIHRDRKHKRKFAQIDEYELENPLPSLPLKWTWTTADQISDDDENAITDGPFGSQLKTDHYIRTPGFRVIRLQNIGSGVFREEHRSYIDQSRFGRLSKHHVKACDLVVAGLVDPRVRCCEVPANIGPALVKADCYRFAVHPNLSSRFALHFLNSPLAQEFAAVHHHGMTLTRIGLGNFRRVPIPLPPLAEQHRIVAKVDELMALCNRLEASLTAGENTRHCLLDALLHEALAPGEGLMPERPERVAAHA